jgi:hypothetical protein
MSRLRHPQGPTITPTPDPTSLTQEAVNRAIAAERDYEDARILAVKEWAEGRIEVLQQRFDGIDRATVVLQETVSRTPTAIQIEIAHLRELDEEKFQSIATQFKERDTRSERESRDNKVAVDAAFAAQKEAASEQNKSNTLAISKSEASTAETINKLAELFTSATDALGDKIDDIKGRLNSLEVRMQTFITQPEATTLLATASARIQALAERATSLELRVQSRLDMSAGQTEGASVRRTEQRLDMNVLVGVLGLLFVAVSVAFGIYAAVHK